MTDTFSDELNKIFTDFSSKIIVYKEEEYTDSLKNEFEETLFDLGKAVLLNDKEPSTWEFVYGLKTTDGNLFKIYSSISLNTGRFRPTGKDAIRVIKWGAGYGPISKSFRVHRTDNWKSNLIKRINSMK